MCVGGGEVCVCVCEMDLHCTGVAPGWGANSPLSSHDPSHQIGRSESAIM